MKKLAVILAFVSVLSFMPSNSIAEAASKNRIKPAVAAIPKKVPKNTTAAAVKNSTASAAIPQKAQKIAAAAVQNTTTSAAIQIDAAPEMPSQTDDTWTNFLNGSGDYWNKEMANNSYSGAVSENYLHNGKPTYRMEIRKTDSYVNGSLRSEISTVKPEAAADESTYNFSVMLPDGGSEDYTLDPEGDEIIAQWHNTPDPGEAWTYPPLSLHTSGDGQYHLYVCWDDNKMSTEEEMDASGKVTSYDLGSYIKDKGNWVDWKFNVKWGWLASQNPTIQIYKNGKKIFELKDKPNTTNDKKGVHMKLGIYKNQWTVKNNPSIVTQRVVYYDNVSIN